MDFLGSLWGWGFVDMGVIGGYYSFWFYGDFYLERQNV
jgi:hypothetical protein